MVLNKHSGAEEDHEPREQGLSYSSFRNYTRKISLVSHEPRELSLWYPRLYQASHSVRVKTGKRDRKKVEKPRQRYIVRKVRVVRG
ncbi:MAG: hypothetical protein LBL20_03470 [Treponema sp.]|jgi:hypothetical protein|nr:hypothetical protein [Treponema sp.]